MLQDPLPRVFVRHPKRTTRTRVVAVLALATITVGASLALLGAAAKRPAQPETQDIVRARRIELVDAKGVPRVVLYLAKDQPVLNFFDPSGKRRLTLLTSSKATTLVLHDDTGSPRVSMTGGHESSGLTVHGADNVAALSLGTDAPGQAHLALRTKASHHGIALRLTKEDAELLAGTGGKAGFKAGLSGGEPVLIMKNAHGKTVFKKP